MTRVQYTAFVKDTGHTSAQCREYKNRSWDKQPGREDWRKPGFAQDVRHPVVCVSLDDALAYIAWLNRKTGHTYRLPTEAEWEYAARGGTDTTRYWGDNPDEACIYGNVVDKTAKQEITDEELGAIHNCSDGYAYTAPVGSFQPNTFKLYDMLGNASEWTCSEITDWYNGKEHICTNNATVRHVSRGGSWASNPHYVRSAVRLDSFIKADISTGFRLAHD